jgi:hypothetical protein
MRMPFVGDQRYIRARIKLATIDPHCAAEAAADITVQLRMAQQQLSRSQVACESAWNKDPV